MKSHTNSRQNGEPNERHLSRREEDPDGDALADHERRHLSQAS